MDERRCAWEECRKIFTPKTHNQIYHTQECCKKATNARIMRKYYEDRARVGGAQRTCKTPNCGTLLSRYNSSKYCAKCEAQNETNRTKSVLEVLGL